MPLRFDLEFPVECDDEYWEHSDPSKRFKQPPGIPSRVTFYILVERLMGLIDIVLRAVVRTSDSQIEPALRLKMFQYPLTKQKILYTTQEGLDHSELTRCILNEADSALNKWMDIIPDHRKFCSASDHFLPTNGHDSKMGPRWPRRNILPSICRTIRLRSPPPYPHSSIKPSDTQISKKHW